MPVDGSKACRRRHAQRRGRVLSSTQQDGNCGRRRFRVSKAQTGAKFMLRPRVAIMSYSPEFEDCYNRPDPRFRTAVTMLPQAGAKPVICLPAP